MIEAIFNTTHLSDVGCTYRLLRRDTARLVASKMSVGGSHAGAEIMLLTVTCGARFVEVPVNYLPRVGISSVTGRPAAALNVGLRMILLVLRFRMFGPRRSRRPIPLAAPAPEPRERLPL
jgi:hypothetical protein